MLMVKRAGHRIHLLLCLEPGPSLTKSLMDGKIKMLWVVLLLLVLSSEHLVVCERRSSENDSR